MLDPKMEQQLNKQIAEEFYSSHLYLAMSAYFSGEDLEGFSHWLRLQADEERDHAMKLFDYVKDQGGKVVLHAIREPSASFDSYAQVFDQVLAHEQSITKMVNELVNLAVSLKDHATQAFLQWFVTEQVEEEASAHEVLSKVKRVGQDGPGLFALDSRLGERTRSQAAAE